MADRDAILAALAPSRAAPAPDAVPDPLAGVAPRLTFADPVAAFRAALEAAGGTLATFPHRAALDRALTAVGPYAVVLRGGPAVAESGAVWWVPPDEPLRARAFLAERVILVVDREDLVDDLHEAYRRIDAAAPPYGCFVSGPSKTADIEQALVIGAHGPCALEVYLYGVG